MGIALTLGDELALKHPHFNDSPLSAEACYILDWAHENGIAYRNKHILDIGAGTGVLSIPMAQRGASSVTSIDICATELEMLREDALKNKLHTIISTSFCDWVSFELTRTYDIVIASMTPAISTHADIDKMIAATHNVGIFVGCGDFKKNTFIDRLIPYHSQPAHVFNEEGMMAKEFVYYIEGKNIPYCSDYFETSWDVVMTFDEARIYAYTELAKRHILPNDSIIETFLQFHGANNRLTITITAQKGIVEFFVDNTAIQTFCSLK